MSDDNRGPDKGAMTPADVPDELVRAALKAYCVHCSLTVGRQPWSDHEEEARVILAAALSLHAQQLREQLAAETAIARDLLQRNVELGTRADNAEAACEDLREQLAAANDTTPSTSAAWEVDAYATRYTAYSTGAADDAPGWPPVDAMHAVVAELAAANARAQTAEARLAEIGELREEWTAGDACGPHQETNDVKREEDVRYWMSEPESTTRGWRRLVGEWREVPDVAAYGHSATQAGGDRHSETTITPDGTGTETTRA